VIIAIDSKEIKNQDDMFHALDSKSPGDEITLRFVRDRKVYEQQLTLGVRRD
ncbi:PDZ domain-containing protein, partial [bacterium]|nr:PDZ domain-containing protein [bacterium]